MWIRHIADTFHETGHIADIADERRRPSTSVTPPAQTMAHALAGDLVVGGLSRVSVWLVRLGIYPERIEPGKPQQNGRQERFHRTLKAETATPPRSSLSAQQRAFDQFRIRYNEERPHQALGMVVPDELHVASSRLFVEDPPDPQYPPTWEERRASPSGYVMWRGRQMFLSAALGRELIGFKPLPLDRFEAYFGPILLGLIDESGVVTRLIRPSKRGRRPSAMSPV